MSGLRKVDKLIINFTPTGMVPTKAMTPFVPISVAEIVDDLLACAELGASVDQLLARDLDGRPTLDPEVSADIVRGIRQERQDLILHVTTGGRTHHKLEDRAAVLNLDGDSKPELVRFTLGSMHFARPTSVNALETIKELAQRIPDCGIRPDSQPTQPRDLRRVGT